MRRVVLDSKSLTFLTPVFANSNAVGFEKIEPTTKNLFFLTMAIPLSKKIYSCGQRYDDVEFKSSGI